MYKLVWNDHWYKQIQSILIQLFVVLYVENSEEVGAMHAQQDIWFLTYCNYLTVDLAYNGLA